MFRPSVCSSCFALATFASFATAKADLIWSQDFTGHADNAFPFRDFTGNSTNDWGAINSEAMFRVSTVAGAPSPALVFTDTNTTNLGNIRLQMSEFAPFSTANPATPILRMAFDWKIEDFSAGAATNEAFRFVLRANNSTASGDQLVLGFNRAALNDGDASNADLAFYFGSPSGTSNFTPTNASAIGLDLGVGWAPGFNFGEYDSASSAANDTDDLFYRFDLSYDFVTGMINGTVTRHALDATDGQSAAFAIAMRPGLDFSNTDANNDVVLHASTNGVTGVSVVDNLAFDAVPEPGSIVASLLGATALTLRRGRRRTAGAGL